MQHVLDAQVRRAHIDGSYGIAYEVARDELDDLCPAEALERTLAMVDQDTVLYDAMALWWICDGIIGRRLTLHHIGWAANRFDEARMPERRHNATLALRGLVE